MAGPTILKNFHQGDRVVVSWRRFTYEATIQSICPQFINIHNMIDLTDGKREKMDYPSETISAFEIRKIFKAKEAECRWDLKKLSLRSPSEERLPVKEEPCVPEPTVEPIPNIRLITAAGNSLLKAVHDLNAELAVGVEFASTDGNTLLISVASPRLVYIFDVGSFDDKIPVELAVWFGQRDCIKAMLLGNKKPLIRVNALFDIRVAYQKVTGNKERSELKDIAAELLGVPPTYFQGTKIPCGRPLSKDALQSLARRAVSALKLYDYLEERLLGDSYKQHEKFSHIFSGQKEKFEQSYRPGELYERFAAGQFC